MTSVRANRSRSRKPIDEYLLSEAQLPLALGYLHSIDQLIAPAYRLQYEELCRCFPEDLERRRMTPEQEEASVAQMHQRTRDFKAELKARRDAAEAARRKQRGW